MKTQTPITEEEAQFLSSYHQAQIEPLEDADRLLFRAVFPSAQAEQEGLLELAARRMERWRNQS